MESNQMLKQKIINAQSAVPKQEIMKHQEKVYTEFKYDLK